MKLLQLIPLGIAVFANPVLGAQASAKEVMPPHFTVQQTDLGPVFADDKGMTLYWVAPGRDGLGGALGGSCQAYARGVGTNQHVSGDDLNQNYRGDATCADKYPIAAAEDDAKPIGKWTIAKRSDGLKQWKYDGHALFRSTKDVVPGDINATTGEIYNSTNPYFAEPAYVPLPIVPGVRVVRNGFGQYLTTTDGMSLYTYDQDRRGQSACDESCSRTWKPILTGTIINSDRPDWSVVTRKDGSRQWAYKGKPLYTNVNDLYPGQRKGENERSWHIALVAPAVPLPPEITERTTWLGQAYGDKAGFSVYVFSCTITVPCDEPSDSAAYSPYWYSFCGAPEDCAKMFRPVIAPQGAKPSGHTWTIVNIKAPWSPVRLPDGAQEKSIRVWAFRGRPLFTFVGDDKPGKFEAFSFERGTGSFRWIPFGPLGEMSLKTQL